MTVTQNLGSVVTNIRTNDHVRRAYNFVMAQTILYQANPASLERNKTKIIVGGAATAAAFLIPGDHPYIEFLPIAYTALKCYHALRDWAGR